MTDVLARRVCTPKIYQGVQTLLVLLHSTRHNKKASIQKPRRETSEKNNLADTLIWDI